MSSIERRVSSSLIITLAAAFILLATLAEYGVKRLSHSFVATRLQHDADTLINALQTLPDGSLSLNADQLPTVYRRVRSGHYYQLAIPAQQTRLRSRSLWDNTPPMTSLAAGASQLDVVRTPQEHWLVWQQGIDYDNTAVTLWLAEDLLPVEQQWHRFSRWLWLVMGTTLLGLWLLQRHLLRRSFSEINAVRNAVRQLQQGEIEQLSQAVPTEIRPLTEEINHLVGRLEQRIARSRSAMGNLAHELKRSLQRLQSSAEQLPVEQRSEVRLALADIQRLVERELQRARIAGSPHPGRRLRPETDLPDLIRVLERIHPAVRFQLSPPPAGELPFDRDDLLELTGNLLDNAAKFGADQVGVSLLRQPQQWVLTVSDNGPGIPPERCDELCLRGSRIDEHVEGHGLGLSICQMIVTSYAGELRLLPATTASGLRVEVSLPVQD
ncbi:sensor histidine kinase [Motiliproteus sediminis]|uniref:sensor histidine kinase n=1 Tax=Motiliproteus sediminis TaxID=1468178 RepID=UPI001AEFE03A|nr:sensor histidine kinase [Motiliproteus sediminis]